MVCEVRKNLKDESVIDQVIDGVWPEGGRVNAPGEMIPLRLNRTGSFLDVYAFPKNFGEQLCQWDLLQKLKNEMVVDAMISNRRLQEDMFKRIVDFLKTKISDLSDKFTDLKKALAGQPKMARLYLKVITGKATDNEKAKAEAAFKDLLKSLGLGLLWAVPFAGTGLLISVALVGKEVGIDPFPTAEYLGMDEACIDEVKLYHGTFPDRVDSVLKKGLEPTEDPERKNYPGSESAVFLTTDKAEAEQWAYRGRWPFVEDENAVVLEVEMSDLDSSKLEPDPAGSPIGIGNYLYRGVIPPSAINLMTEVVDKLIKQGPEEQHIELDPDFFDENNHLLPDVRDVLLLVVTDVLQNLEDKSFGFHPAFQILTGSLCGPDWDKDSDVDLHVGVDFSQVAHEAELFKTYLGLYARQFNLAGYKLAGRDLELYFQDVTEEHEAPGVYDLVSDTWMQIPTGVKIDVTSEMKKAAAAYLTKIEELEVEFESQDPYGNEATMLLHKVTSFWEGLRAFRSVGLEAGGRASFGNQMFKLLRRNGGLEKLTTLIRDIQDRVYDVARTGV